MGPTLHQHPLRNSPHQNQAATTKRRTRRNLLLAFLHATNSESFSKTQRLNPRLQDSTEVCEQPEVSQLAAVKRPGFLWHHVMQCGFHTCITSSCCLVSRLGGCESVYCGLAGQTRDSAWQNLFVFAGSGQAAKCPISHEHVVPKNGFRGFIPLLPSTQPHRN